MTGVFSCKNFEHYAGFKLPPRSAISQSRCLDELSSLLLHFKCPSKTRGQRCHTDGVTCTSCPSAAHLECKPASLMTFSPAGERVFEVWIGADIQSWTGLFYSSQRDWLCKRCWADLIQHRVHLQSASPTNWRWAGRNPAKLCWLPLKAIDLFIFWPFFAFFSRRFIVKDGGTQALWS